ncbi:MAG: EMC3/TMCO1 family protein [Candidatus Hermodarchaeota archaeon]
MAVGDIVIQIFLITVAMVAFSEILNKLMGSNMGTARDLREQAKNLQERMRLAQLTKDMEELYKLQQESIQLTKQMMKKQILPSCVRCIIFFGIFAVLNFIYADYVQGIFPFPILFFGSGWFAVYFLFSIGLSLLVWGIKKLYRWYTGKEDMRKKESNAVLGVQSLEQHESEGHIQLTRPLPEPYIEEPQTNDQNENESNTWKTKIKR